MDMITAIGAVRVAERVMAVRVGYLKDGSEMTLDDLPRFYNTPGAGMTARIRVREEIADIVVEEMAASEGKP